MSAGTFERSKAEVEERKDRRERLALRNKQESEKKTLRIIRGIERRNRNEKVYALPNGLGEKAANAIPCRWPEPVRKKQEGYQ